ncbi:O-antigen ligase family protein [Bradyrhizobium sp. SZCCHNR1070]|uniref:O-antigen ligase family protein n=1 Tax=Bradyrhizobium sp. SZCCHNR1070 TaxID=3057361 RepID=UPI002916F1BA|nr:O-antigen ligase family protein [Bradyrhizobium sp. SZCCHNR1070]
MSLLARNPARNDVLRSANWQRHIAWAAWLCCAVSLAFIQAVPTIPAVIMLGSALLYSGLYPLQAQRVIFWNFLPWMLPLFGSLSMVWSDQPALSARAAAQIAITIYIAILFAQSLPAYRYIANLMYAFLASVVASQYETGIFGAKNSFGLAVALAMLASCWVMLDSKQPKITRFVALGALFGAPSLLIAAGSEGALLGAGVALFASFIPFLLRQMSANARISTILIAAVVVLAGLGIAFLSVDNLFEVLLLSIGKDTSLTGRTLLWSYATDVIANHPLGGVGLQAFWVEGNRAAEQFWAFFYIYTRSGFHFHDLWLEIGVELGLTGIFLAAATVITVVFNVVRWVLRDPQPEGCFFLGFIAFVTLRTIGEVELFIQFALMPIIFMGAYYYAREANTAWDRAGQSAAIKPRAMR